ncbi:MAG: F0F1 ATP synthase subunit alpha [Myxococcales bacterium]
MASFAERLGAIDLGLRGAFRPRGAVVEVGDGVARVVGLEGAGSEELVAFDSGAFGMAYELEPAQTGVVLLSGAGGVCAGEGVEPLGKLPSLPVGRGLLGRVLDPLGRPLDDRPAPPGESCPIFREAPSLTERAPVQKPLLTGVMVIDAAIPIGRGQRQLLVGDRNVGKTSLALDIVAAQRAGDVTCVFVLIGQPMSRVLSVREWLQKSGALPNTVVIASDAADPPGLQYLAPYAGAAVAEWFRDRGGDALVVYDDLTKHADAYRELALLLGRPPGREAFPGDIFYIHAQLLERATALAESAGGGSVTAFPIVETTESDISSYIPTNLISITDGQVYLDTALFERNRRPAVDVGRSVSRVGGAAQPASTRSAARNLRITLSQFEALEALTRVGLDVDPGTRQAVERGRILREILRQPRFTVRTVADQLVALTAVAEGWLDGSAPEEAARMTWAVAERVTSESPDIARALDAGAAAPEGWKERLHALFQPSEKR